MRRGYDELVAKEKNLSAEVIAFTTIVVVVIVVLGGLVVVRCGVVIIATVRWSCFMLIFSSVVQKQQHQRY